jgi:hypothetical protein
MLNRFLFDWILILNIGGVSLIPVLFLGFQDTAVAQTAKQGENFSIVNEKDWRSQSFTQIPLSVPVMVRDEFNGDYLAVFDRNYQGDYFWTEREAGVMTMWSRQTIKAYFYQKNKSPANEEQMTILETENLDLKLGDRVFKLTGKNGIFSVTEDLVTALSNVPSKSAKMRIIIRDNGQNYDSDIGEKTIDAWKVVYRK